MTTLKTKSVSTFLVAIVCSFLLLLAARSSAQTANIQSRITQPVIESQRTVLRGNTHPLARPQFDRGAAPSSLAMDQMFLVLKRSPAQEAALEKLLAEQQDKSSANYHKWLTPVQFGQLFGASDRDIQKVSSWLTSHGFSINTVSNGRLLITFSGTAGQVEEAFHAPIHKFVVHGEEHWANANDPDIPEALAPVVAGVRSLHDFFPKPMHRVKLAATPKMAAGVKSQYTFPAGANGCNVLSSNFCFGLGPTDFATIYNVLPAWNAGFDGSGETIAVISDSNINIQDARDFRSIFGLPPNDPVVIIPPGGSDPGLQPNSDEIEAILDVEWSGAVAKNATIDLVTSKSTVGHFGGDLAAQYVIDFPNSTNTNSSTGLAPILSESFGDCELDLGTAGNAMYDNMWSQAAAEGITVLISSGDNGSAGCDVEQVSGSPTQAAQLGLAVNGLASTPFNVAVGGTDFNDYTNFCAYWDPCDGGTNAPITEASALSYIPETTWNDSCTNSVFITGFNSQFGTTPQAVCNNATIAARGLVVPVGGSGGKSACITSNGTLATCAGGNPKPAFQNGVTPDADTTRDIPDVSLFAGDGEISASFYVVCESDFQGIDGAACNLSNNKFLEVGGTSVSTQVFAGIMALIDQKTGSRQGNANTVLYSLAKAEFAANCNANSPPPGTCVFNDVSGGGTISMPCATGSPDCTTNAAGLQPWPRRVKWPAVTTLVTLVCILCIGALLICFRGSSRKWTTAMASLAVVALAANAGCGSGSGGGGGGGGGGTPSFGVQSGGAAYNAGTGYDLATGLGSVNVENLVMAKGWAAVPDVPNTRTPLSRDPATLPQHRNWQAAVRAIVITCVFCLGILLIGFWQRSRRSNAALALVAFVFLVMSVGIVRAGLSGVSIRALRASSRPTTDSLR
jgi:hypothetical protein